MTNLKSCDHYLSMSITCDRINKILHMSQKSYVEKIFERFNMTNCKIASIFMNVETKLKFNIEDVTVSKIKLFQIMMNNLIYLIYCTRLNVEYVVQCFSKFNMNSFKETFEIIKKMLRYLKEIKKTTVTYEFNVDFQEYIDADHANDITTRRSIDVYLFLLYKSAVNWSSKLQTCVALSFCEAEYMTQTQTCKKIIWISRLLKKLNMNYDLSDSSVIIKTDNQETIALFKNSKFHFRTKHIDVQWHFVKKQVKKKTMQFEYCSINEMIADGLIKSLNKIKFQKFVKMTELVRVPFSIYRI